jgi:hypothetical protein
MARRIRGKNEGSLYQRPNGAWRAQLSVDGQRISKGFKAKAEAQEWLRATQTQVERGFDYHAGKITLAEYLPQWLEGTGSRCVRRPQINTSESLRSTSYLTLAICKSRTCASPV